jgi:hypothetical protein
MHAGVSEDVIELVVSSIEAILPIIKVLPASDLMDLFLETAWPGQEDTRSWFWRGHTSKRRSSEW